MKLYEVYQILRDRLDGKTYNGKNYNSFVYLVYNNDNCVTVSVTFNGGCLNYTDSYNRLKEDFDKINCILTKIGDDFTEAGFNTNVGLITEEFCKSMDALLNQYGYTLGDTSYVRKFQLTSQVTITDNEQE